MEWQLKPVSRQSALSGVNFEPGQRIVSLLCAGEDGVPVRADVLTNEEAAFEAPGKVLGRWQRTLKAPAKTEREAEEAEAASAEELFLSLQQSAAQSEQAQRWAQALAVMLERRRVLRGLGPAKNGQRVLLHVPTRTEHTLPWVEWEPLTLFETIDQLRTVLTDS
ncbi:MAG: hypothetical protein ACFBZ8_12570 [Opitutales bacterium]